MTTPTTHEALAPLADELTSMGARTEDLGDSTVITVTTAGRVTAAVVVTSTRLSPGACVWTVRTNGPRSHARSDIAVEAHELRYAVLTQLNRARGTPNGTRLK